MKTEEFIRFCKDNPNIDLLFVNDGSRDNTLDVLSMLSINAETISYLNLAQNVGKAEAVRQGILHAYGKAAYGYLGFMDADLATPLQEAVSMLNLIKNII
ncbi:MAG: glycosyltransferase [Bacteroidales bacterium]|nr:glycosyltransferase [Bacteroidales bacterium]